MYINRAKYAEGPQQYLIVCQSELQFIGGVTNHWGEIETGGELYGLFSHAGRPVIMLASPPGPNAIHGVARFRQDIDFMKKVNAFVGDTFGIQYLGNWHNHHNLSIKGLSGGDVESTHSIAQKNAYQRFCQLVLTFEGNVSDSFKIFGHYSYNEGFLERSAARTGWNRRMPVKTNFWLDTGFTPTRHKVQSIRVHSFLYSDAMYGEPIRCPIRIIPGISPIRQTFNSAIPIIELTKPSSFPMPHIRYDHIEQEVQRHGYHEELPPRLTNQFRRLPAQAMKNVRVQFKEGLILFSLPIHDKNSTVIVAYNEEPPYKVMAAYLYNKNISGKSIDLTAEALCRGPFTMLRTIYRRVIRLMGQGNSDEQPDNSTRTADRIISVNQHSRKKIYVGNRAYTHNRFI